MPRPMLRLPTVLLLTLVGSGSAAGQDPAVGPVMDAIFPYRLDTGVLANTASQPQAVHHHVLTLPGAPSLRVLFAEISLGPGDYVEVTGLADNEQHRLDPAELAKWSNSSAYFNGDTLEIRMVLQPGSSGRYVIHEVIGGLLPVFLDTICGTDDRIPSTDNRSMRLVSSPNSSSGGCTIWLAGPTDAALTAGHCPVGSSSVAEANVPPSLSNGAAQHPLVSDQFPVVSLGSTSGGQGNDWRICRLLPNNLGQSAASRFGWFIIGSFIPTANETIRITGYGTDSGVQNVTPQTSTGPYFSTSGTILRYRVDTTGGNSGSPVIHEATGQAVGIHTHGGCTSTGGSNAGTSLTLSSFQSAYLSLIGPFPTAFSLDLTTAGNGNLHLALGNFSSSASGGFTLVSFDTSAPIGQGTVFGIRADLFTLQSLAIPASPTNIFHFVAPFQPGSYPLAAFDLPPGTLSNLAGVSMDAQVVSFEPGFTNVLTTNVVRVTF